MVLVVNYESAFTWSKLFLTNSEAAYGAAAPFGFLISNFGVKGEFKAIHASSLAKSTF